MEILSRCGAPQHSHVSKREIFLRSTNRLEIRVWLYRWRRHDIHASENDQNVVTVRITPVVSVEKARVLESLGWQVHITVQLATSSTLWTSTGFHRLLTR